MIEFGKVTKPPEDPLWRSCCQVPRQGAEGWVAGCLKPGDPVVERVHDDFHTSCGPGQWGIHSPAWRRESAIWHGLGLDQSDPIWVESSGRGRFNQVGGVADNTANELV